MTAGWTDDRVGALKKLWLEGQSASQIAKQLGGGVTRNAVIGKAHRLGLKARPSPVVTKEEARAAAVKAQPPSASSVTTGKGNAVTPSGAPKTIAVISKMSYAELARWSGDTL
mgnify:CR=1 FL=1